jgi:hypothetical protein
MKQQSLVTVREFQTPGRDTWSSRPAVGIRFWDDALAQLVTDGLQVTARTSYRDQVTHHSTQTRSGVYAFQDLPLGHGTLLFVADRQGRFLPFGGAVALASDSVATVSLLSAPTRAPTPGLSLFSALLWDRNIDAPAAFAVLELNDSDRWWQGVADERGALTLAVPMPVYQPSLLQEPGNQRVGETQRKVALRVRYAGGLRPLPGWPLPDMQAILGQAYGSIHETVVAGAAPLSTWELVMPFGREVVLRTDELPRLLISQATG